MRRPSFQFYPGDWTGNSNLRRCTHTEKGVWLEIMCLMHDQAEYGVLRWPLKEIVEAVKCKPSDVRALVSKGVLKGGDSELAEPFIYTPRSGRRDGEPVTLIGTQAGPIWYSSRMVKDEYVRTIRGESSRFGEELSESPKPAPKRAPKPPFGDGSSSPSSSSTSVNSVPDGTGGKPPTPAPAPPQPAAPDAGQPALPSGELSKSDLWKAAVSLLDGQGMPEPQARAFIGKLSKDFPEGDTVLEAVREAIATQPADARAWLSAACQRSAGRRPAAARRPTSHTGLAGQNYSQGVNADGSFA